MIKPSYGMLKRRRDAQLRKISKIGPFMMATADWVKVKCGNPKCKCARDKEKRHEKLHLGWTDSQGSGTQYVPVGLREEVLEWIENYWKLKECMKEVTSLTRQMIRMYGKTYSVRAKQQQRKQRMGISKKKKTI